MNKSELIDHVARTADLGRRQAEAALDAVVQAVISETKSGNKIALSGFGTFAPTSRAARMGRNPQTGAPVQIAASNGVKFSPATAFKTELNPRAGAKKAASGKKASAKKATGKKAPAKKSTAKKATPAKKAGKSTKKR